MSNRLLFLRRRLCTFKLLPLGSGEKFTPLPLWGRWDPRIHKEGRDERPVCQLRLWEGVDPLAEEGVNPSAIRGILSGLTTPFRQSVSVRKLRCSNCKGVMKGSYRRGSCRRALLPANGNFHRTSGTSTSSAVWLTPSGVRSPCVTTVAVCGGSAIIMTSFLLISLHSILGCTVIALQRKKSVVVVWKDLSTT